MPKQLHFPAIKSQQYRATGKRSGVFFTIVITRHLVILIVPEIIRKIREGIRDLFHLIKHIIKVFQLFLMLFCKSYIPYIIMTEIKDNSVWPGSHYYAHT